MKLGIHLSDGGRQFELPLPLIMRAEALGYDSVWVAESYGRDAFSPLAYIGALTKKIRLATGVAQISARTPTNLAMMAQTIDAMTGQGRLILGIGMSGPQVVEGWYGQPWGKPNLRIRDTVAIVRKILKREAPLTHDGKQISVPYAGADASGYAKPLKSILVGNPDIPIYLGTATPLNTKMAGEIGDGWIGMHLAPASVSKWKSFLAEGLARRSDKAKFAIWAVVRIHATDDVKEALQALKPQVALAIGGLGARDKNFHADMMASNGFADAANRIQELYLSGRTEEAAAAVPDEYLDEEALVGPPARLKERLARWRDAGVTGVTLQHPTLPAIEALAEFAGE